MRAPAELPVVAAGPSAARTPAQQRFAALISQIERQRALLLAWQSLAATYEQRLAGRLQPCVDRIRAARIALVHLLDRATRHAALGKTTRAVARERLLALAADLLADQPDPAVLAVHDFHSAVPYAQIQARALGTEDVSQDQDPDLDPGLEAGLGRAQDHDGAKAAPELSVEAQAQAIADQAEAEWQARAEHARAQRPRVRPAGRVRAQQAAREQSALDARQALRAVYRKLAMALHPDRETDASRRDYKTQLMREANQAYGAKDLVALLELQARIAHVDAVAITSLGGARLDHFIQVLAEQLAGLEQQVQAQQQRYGEGLDVRRSAKLTPERVLRALDADIRATRLAADTLESDLLDLRDIAVVKAWLRRERPVRR